MCRFELEIVAISMPFLTSMFLCTSIFKSPTSIQSHTSSLDPAEIVRLNKEVVRLEQILQNCQDEAVAPGGADPAEIVRLNAEIIRLTEGWRAGLATRDTQLNSLYQLNREANATGSGNIVDDLTSMVAYLQDEIQQARALPPGPAPVAAVIVDLQTQITTLTHERDIQNTHLENLWQLLNPPVARPGVDLVADVRGAVAALNTAFADQTTRLRLLWENNTPQGVPGASINEDLEDLVARLLIANPAPASTGGGWSGIHRDCENQIATLRGQVNRAGLELRDATPATLRNMRISHDQQNDTIGALIMANGGADTLQLTTELEAMVQAIQTD